MFAEVIVDVKTTLLNQCFDYAIPLQLIKKIQKGMRVIVPFGLKNTYRLGYVLNLKQKSHFSKKTIITVLEKTPFLNQEFFLIAEELLKIPFVTKTLVYRTIIPKSFLFSYIKKVIPLKKNLISEEIQKYLNKKKWILNLKSKDVVLQKELVKLEKKKILKTQIMIKKINPIPKKNFYFLNSDIKKTQKIQLTPKEKIFLKELKQHITKQLYPKYILKEKLLLLTSNFIIQNMLKKNILLSKQQKILFKEKKLNYCKTKWKKKIILNTHQQTIYEKIDFKKNQTYLLYYNNLRDKIQIYLKLINETIRQDKQILIIVPEIILIDFLVKEIKAVFPSLLISILHHNLKEIQNFQENEAIKEQKKNLVIGTRKAIFAPLKNLGCLIIDQEHDESLIEKDRNPSYDVKELALLRTFYHHIPLILASSSPSLETYYRIKLKKIIFLNLKDQKYFSDINLINMKQELLKGNVTPFSNSLMQAILNNMKKKEKTFLFIHSLGYSAFVLCSVCSFIPKCSRCKRKMTFYFQKKILKCRFCNLQKSFLSKCPNCFNSDFKEINIGIEYVENFLKKSIPNIKIMRLDSDSIVNSVKLKNLNSFFNNPIDLLLGTEMLIKNIPLRNISLIGVLMVDLLLNIPTFKANEKTFQILNQIKLFNSSQTKIIIQSYNTDHYVLQSVINYDNNYFFKKALRERKIAFYPPFSFISQILISHKQIYKLRQVTFKIKKILENYLEQKIQVLGPNTPYIFKKNNFYRYFLTLKYQFWPLNLDFINKNNLQEDAFLLFNRFANII